MVIATACTGTTVSINAVGINSFVSSVFTISADQVVEWDNTTGSNHTVTSITLPANCAFDIALNSGTSVCLEIYGNRSVQL
jgi:plastocyanin